MPLTNKSFKKQVRLAIPNDSSQQLGGGWTFRRNLIKGIKSKCQVVDRIEDANIVLLTSATMITRDTVEKIKRLNKKFVLRIDNVPRNSRNRNTGASRLKDYAKLADKVVYQSNWAKDYLSPFVKKDGEVIYNGVDTDIFSKDGPRYDFKGEPVFLYSRYNRDETKRWEEAWFKYQAIQRENPSAKLVIVGNFSPEQIEYNFDFFMGENYEYRGIVTAQEEMAKILRGCDFLLATYYNDCYSNTYQEALACGVELFEPNMSGGTPELIKRGVISLELMADDYLKVFEEVIV